MNLIVDSKHVNIDDNKHNYTANENGEDNRRSDGSDKDNYDCCGHYKIN